MTVSRTALILILAGTAVPAIADQITCHSSQPRPEPCGTVQPGSIVRLARQLSDRPCIEGRTWGTGPDRDSIWVSSGCSAVFDIQPPGGYADDGSGYRHDRGTAGPAPGDRRSPEFERGFADGQHGNADPNATSQEYLEGFRAGEDAAREQNRYGARGAPPRGPSDNPGVFEPVPNAPGPDRRNPPAYEGQGPDAYANRGAPPPPNYDAAPDRNYPPPPPGAYPGPREQRYASIDQHRAIARQACLDAASRDRRYGPDRIISREVRWIGHGEFAVSLETPEGELTCMVDRDGNVHSIDDR